MKCYWDINYTAHDDDMRRLDLFVPDTDCRATVMWMHGGGIEGGNRKNFEGIARQLCGTGVALASVEYRMFPQVGFPVFIEDCASAAAWLRAHAGEYGASDTIYIGGSSAGGYLTMMLCFAREYLAAAGLTPEDFDGYFFDAGQPTTHFNILKYRGEDSRRCLIDEAAPLFHVRDNRPDKPIYILCSDNDMAARLEQNRLLVATLKHMGYDMSKVRMDVMEGYSHCGYCYEEKDGRWVMADLIERFVDFVGETAHDRS